MKQFDVAIVGSGPAGAMTAYTLIQQGISTVLIEKEKLPRYKTCGGGLVYRGRKMLPFDISQAVEREFHTVDIYMGRKTHFATTRLQPIISMVMRDTFDHFIIEKAKTGGLTLLEEEKVTGLNHTNEHWHITTTNQVLAAKFVIAADGALSPIAKMAGWAKDTRKLIPALEYEVVVSDKDFERLSQSVRFDIDAIPGGYAWSFPKKNHLSLGVASAKRTRLNLKEYYRKYVEFLEITEVISETQHGFQIPVAPRTDGFAKNGVFLTGDAAGFADPITAEGISNSIYSGILAAEAIAQSNLNTELAEKIYLEKLEIKLLPELKTGILLSKFFYDQKTIRNLMLKKYGNRFCEAMADIFMGDKSYPHNAYQKIQEKVKDFIF